MTMIRGPYDDPSNQLNKGKQNQKQTSSSSSEMKEVPSLLSLAMDAIKQQLIREDDDDDDDNDVSIFSQIYELPSHLFDGLVTRLPPLILHKLQIQMPLENSNAYECPGGCYRKRRRCDFNAEWRSLFKSRWSLLFDSIESVDWHQTYWEAHLQNCLDEAAGSSMLSSDCSIEEIKVPEFILKWIGCEGHLKHSIYSKLYYHFQLFGHYARCLRLQSVLCVAETCKLLRNSQLQSLTLRWIRSEEFVDGLCQLLIQNSETLTSLEFINCSLSSTFADAICRSLEIKNRQTHGIKNFSIRTSMFLETGLVCFPPSFVSFLSSGRSLSSLKFSGNNLDQNFARILFTLLCNASSSVSTLDLSDNDISGWLSKSSSRVLSSLDISKSLQSLRILNIRNNNLHKYEVESLKCALLKMPNLEILDLGENPIKDEGIRCLIPYFAEALKKCSPLVELNLEGCDLSWEGVTLLLDALSNLEKSLNSLTLADNYLGSPIAGALGKFLGTSIKELNIGGIGLGLDGFQELERGVMGELKLVRINISKNRGGIETAKFLTKLILFAPDLVAVNASYNLMPVESLTLICSTLKAAKGKLQSLDLTGTMRGFQQTHASMLSEFQHNGKPIFILSSLLAPNIPYDDDP